MAHHYAIVPAAGSGSRFGAEMPKQYLSLAGCPLIHHTLAALCRCPAIERVWVVLSPGDRYWPQYDWSALGAKLETVYCGGETRAQSVANGLAAAETAVADDDWVLVHDAARPCVSAAMLDALCRELADDAVGGLLAAPVADTLKRAGEGQRVQATLSRDGLWQAQTPQMFRYGVLRRSLAAFPDVTDEAGAIEAAGYAPRLVRADASNLKVTFPADLALAEMILKSRREDIAP
ncbi:2-C-methyl-D-erythritol 4-phosphate cytidylyltransferase [Rhodocyclus tenuis]|uniref:2-C-methyl-D-erythritol 4-phosphate cytidylyltransferase n=1 Tax=Rhodocyclus gracilis TaxID=2929842 RepID=A0ABX0WEI5_9RHOO|nr:2-C-methyl-D-erythritol 4-phosphate cytidylyltransferase [Rhodocyclus gracilis]NJA87939.1 2-C-methyl-D-erythritol 4-phosphate cytidylyltransferase [Rhodocyclus gracilis]